MKVTQYQNVAHGEHLFTMLQCRCCICLYAISLEAEIWPVSVFASLLEHFSNWMIHTEVTCVKQCDSCVPYNHICPFLTKSRNGSPCSKFGLMWVMNCFIWTITEIATCRVADIPHSSIRRLCYTISWQFVSSLIVVMCKACFSPEVCSC